MLNNLETMEEYYRDKQSGDVLTEEEMLDLVDEDDDLGSFYLIGMFKTREEAEESLKQ